MTQTNTKRGDVVVWAALVIAIIALVLAWSAYNKAPGADLEERVQQEVEEAMAELEQAADEVEQEIPDDIDVDVDTDEDATTTDVEAQ